MRKNQIVQKKALPHQSRGVLKKIVSVFGILFTVLTGFYVMTGMMLNPRFFVADAKEKAGIVKGVMISMRVVGEPGKPTVTAEAECDALSPKVALAWGETIDTTVYDIERDGSPLITGLTETSYEDTTVDAQTAYSYIVIAQGPRGSTSSDPAVIETLDCTNNSPATCSVVTIDEKNVVGENGTVSISSHSPKFTGTTNIANAHVRIELVSANPTVATFDANANGYWSWQVPFDLSLGLHRLTVTATDPIYDWRTTTDIKYFKIVSKEEEEEDKKKKTKDTMAAPAASTVPSAVRLIQNPDEPLELGLEVLNSGAVAYVGGDLNLKSVVIPKEISLPHDLDLLYRVYAVNREDILFQQKKSVTLKSRDPSSFFHNLRLPVLLRPGRYIISVQTSANGFFISTQANFEVREVPLFSIGAINVTWSRIMEILSWVSWGLLSIILFFLGLLELEHHWAAKALFQITENILWKKGYFSRRKGVSQ